MSKVAVPPVTGKSKNLGRVRSSVTKQQDQRRHKDANQGHNLYVFRADLKSRTLQTLRRSIPSKLP